MILIWIVNHVAEQHLSALTVQPTSKRQQQQQQQSRRLHFPNFTSSTTNNYLVAEVLRGRLGNNMFQYGSAYGVFRANNKNANLNFCVADRKRPKFRDLTKFYQGPFGPVCSNAATMNNTTTTTILNETGYGTYTNFTISSSASSNHVTILREYLISFKYMDHIKDEIRHVYQLKGRARKRQRDDFLKSVYSKNIKLIGIHVRRTDIARDKSYRNPPLLYYQRAMEYFRNEYNHVHFIIASDDKPWCAKHILSNISNDITILPDTFDPVTEMAILSKCHGMILSIGTFGWWAAYLNDNTDNATKIMYWNQVFDMNHIKHKNLLTLDDYYPPNWIGID